jgi:hypothetical protein
VTSSEQSDPCFKTTKEFFFNKISVATRNQNLVNRIIGGGRISTSCLLSFPLFYFWSNKHRSGNRWYNWWMKRKLNVTDNLTAIFRFILHHKRVPGTKILKVIEFRGFNFRGPKYYTTFGRFRSTNFFSSSCKCRGLTK